MAVPLTKTSFASGEVAPALFGHVDLARFQSAASTMRNLYVGYRGGAYSRAGTQFVGFSKQTGRSYSPRLINFQFSINQGLALEFGNYYMRVIRDGGMVTEPAVTIVGATRANPCVITISAISLASVTPNIGGVSATYAQGDNITLAGGTYATPAVVQVGTTQLASFSIGSRGETALGAGYIGYRPNDIIYLNGGGATTLASVIVTTTTVVAAAVNVSFRGIGGTPGPVVLTGTSGTGTRFQINGVIGAGGSLDTVSTFVTTGSYTSNPNYSGYPYYAYLEGVTGGGLSGCSLTIQMGVGTASVLSGGEYTTNPPGAIFGQAYTTGGGAGATFTPVVMAPKTCSVVTPGNYSVAPSDPIAQASTTGSGVGVTFNGSFISAASFNAGDWIYITGVSGMVELNAGTYVVNPLTSTTMQLLNVYGAYVNSTAFGAYISGGTAARIYTLATPYAEADIKYLKFTQSADVMSITCVNQDTNIEYAPIDLIRAADDSWSFQSVTPETTIDPPATVSGSATGSGSVNYEYVVTTVSPDDGTESIASSIASIPSAVDIAGTAGSITLTWSPISGVHEYNVYKATPGYGAPIPAGALFGYAGSAYGTQFVDSNIVADFTQVPPLHRNPFARGQITAVNIVSSSATFTGDATFTITTSTGSGAVITPVMQGSGSTRTLVAFIIQTSGENYKDTDTITITGPGGTATATLVVGAQTGTYPSVVAYFQQRRVFANSLNNPDTYWMSQPGAFDNFDVRIPTIDSDAITGSPWSVQVNGIQWLVQTSGGLLVMTGQSAWLLVGTGSFATNIQPISPSQQAVTPQAFTGASATIPPIKINYDVLYVTSKGSLYYDLPYQLYALSEPLDVTENSPHLFVGYTIKEHAWCEQPYKVLWSVRDDGVMLSLTFYKSQQIAGWARHDTQGEFTSCCSVTEPPIDALYVATHRYPGGKDAYMIERMDDHIWPNVEDCWCVDCGLSLPQPTPAATLSVSSPTGLGAIPSVTGLVGGSGYSSFTTAQIVDDNGLGPGTGAVPALAIVGGVITAITFTLGNRGSGYVNPKIVITDPTNSGSGASATAVLDNSATFTASAAVFSSGNVGDVIRIGGGVAKITSYTNSTHVVANILSPITDIIPNTNTVRPATAGLWTMTTPVTSISGLEHLAGATVTGLADGNVIPPTVVSSTGVVTLPTAASSVTVGLGFTAQLQSVYLDAGSPTIQGQRKKIAVVTARIEASRGLQIGANQPDGSVQSPQELAPEWDSMTGVPDDGPNFPVKPYNALATPLRTGDIRIPVSGGFATPGQVAVQQENPLPMQILAFIPELLPGDTIDTQVSQRRG
jgi:hypothetical protein